MKLVIWCVTKASVSLPEYNETRSINKWLLVYVWISSEDTDLPDDKIDEKIQKIVDKLVNVKFFLDPETDKIELSLTDINGSILLISNFTLYWKNKKVRKLDFTQAGKFEKSKKIYDKLIKELLKKADVKTWEFWAHMIVECVNDGPLNYVINY